MRGPSSHLTWNDPISLSNEPKTYINKLGNKYSKLNTCLRLIQLFVLHNTNPATRVKLDFICKSNSTTTVITTITSGHTVVSTFGLPTIKQSINQSVLF